MTERYCPCVSDHVPNAKVLHKHHIVPKAWGGTDGSPQVVSKDVPGLIDANLIGLCPTSHENVHRLLNEFVRQDGVPPWEFAQHYTRMERLLATAAWDWWRVNEHTAQPPWTTSGGVDILDLSD